MNTRIRRLDLAMMMAGVLSLGTVWAAGSQEQSAPASSASTDNTAKEAAAPAQLFESVVLTGSMVPTTPGKVIVGISTVDGEQIDKAGVNTNLLDILRKQVSTVQGIFNNGSTNTGSKANQTAGGSAVQLLNLDTLVLVNGRRAAVSGIGGIAGGRFFVDLNQIPAAAIERVELLTDGSSAIYGSDAIGGAVNIILKADYEGGEISGHYGSASGYSEHSEDFVVGKAIDKLNFTIWGSASGNTPLRQNQRGFSQPMTGRSSVVPGTIGGATPAILAPGLNAPAGLNQAGVNATATSMADLIANGTYLSSTTSGIASTYDLAPFQTLLMRQGQHAIGGTFTDELLGKRLVLFGDLEYAKNKSKLQFAPVTRTVTVPNGAPYNPVAANVAGVNWAYWPQPLQYDNQQESERVTLGLRGELSKGWGWEAAAVHSQNTLQQQQSNVIYQPNLALAIAGGYDQNGNPVAGGAYSKVYGGFSTSNALVLQPALNPFARSGGVNPAALANLYGTEVIDTKSELNSFDATLYGSLFNMPAGKSGFAVGLSKREETLHASADPNGTNTGPTAQRWIGGSANDAFSSRRTVDGAFVELRVPLTSTQWSLPGAHALDLIGAERREKYSDAGSSSVPKIGFLWQPVDEQLTVRGAYSKSFTAPSLYAKEAPTDTRIVGSAVIQNVFGLANPGFNGEDGNNPDLAPSTSQTRSLSATFIPKAIPGLWLTAEYHNISQRGYPGGIGFTNILQSVDLLGAASPFAADLAKGNFPGMAGATGFANPGDLSAYLRANPANASNLYAIDRFMNLGGLRVEAYNLSAGYTFDTKQSGEFALTTSGTVLKSFQFQGLPSQRYYEYAGTASAGGTGSQGTLPKVRFYTMLNWTLDRWTYTLGNNYMSSVTDIGPGGLVYETSTTLKPQHVSSYMSWDLRASYSGQALLGKFGKGWTIAVGVNNLANRMPPAAPQAFKENNADVATYSPIGRMTYVNASLKF